MVLWSTYIHTHTEIYIITQSEFVNQRVTFMKLILFAIRINHTVVTVFILQLLHAFSIKPYIIIQRRVLES